LPFLDDFLSSRSRRFIVNGPEDLPRLRYLLMPPTAAQVAASLATSEAAITIAKRDDLLLAGGWGVGADLFGWVYGLERMIYAMYDRPEFVRELLDIVATWNRARMEAVLGWGIDLYIKRAWYENLDFFSPALWRKFIFPTLKGEADLAHEHGAKFGYLITSNCMPLLDMLVEAGVDAVIGVDPEQWDLAETKKRLGGRICLWGGVNGHHTVEEGDEEEVREAVRRAMAVLSPGGGFVLSPVDNVRQPSLHSLAMARVMLDQWRRLTGQALL
jgi:uroporphyrinogen-III decarboxylase